MKRAWMLYFRNAKATSFMSSDGKVRFLLKRACLVVSHRAALQVQAAGAIAISR